MGRYNECGHECEVKQRDVDDVRYDLERKIEDQQHTIRHLEGRIDSLREEISSLWEAVNTRGK